MLKRTYDPNRSYAILEYTRVSDPKKQNPRSPEQQVNTIEETRQRLGYPWRRLTVPYRDGNTGRKVRKRPAFLQMLRDIETGRFKPDLIVVDTMERLGRASEIRWIRHKLYTQFGILVVAADNGFADPTGVTGEATQFIEHIRSTEHTRITAHNVLRGKKDAARRGRWPGGPAPFGFRLEPKIDESVTPPRGFSILLPHDVTGQFLANLFHRALVTGDGDVRLARWWNENPEIPDEFKPVSESTILYRLTNPIAMGTLRLGEKQTDIINDTRVVEPNPDGAEYFPGFCLGVVNKATFEEVQRTRLARKRPTDTEPADDGGDSKLIKPLCRGLILRYPLTGLVRCAACNGSMRPVASGRKSKSGTRYVYYACPRKNSGACPNRHHFREPALRDVVFACLRGRLVAAGPASGMADWFGRVSGMLEEELAQFCRQAPDREAHRRRQLDELAEQMRGLFQSLKKESLAVELREDLEAEYARCRRRQRELEGEQDQEATLEKQLQKMLNADAVRAAADVLGEALDRSTPTLLSLELAKHVDVIRCSADGTVELRGTYLGLFAGATELLRRHTPTSPPMSAIPQAQGDFAPVEPRVRGRLHVPDLAPETGLSGLAEDTTLDPDRFASVPDQFFWTEKLILATALTPSAAKATDVVRRRLEGLVHEELAEEFGLSVPTIRKILREAEADNPALRSLPRKMPRRRWHEDHADAVAAEAAKGKGVREMARQFAKSEPTIRKALEIAKERAECANPKPSQPPGESPEAA